MKTTENNIKRSYSSPEIHIISLDNEISLILNSDRVLPNDPESDLHIPELDYFEDTPFE
jgi:hypothetical protein